MSKLLEYAVNTEFYKDFINKIETLDEVHIENSNDNINLLSLLVLFQQKNENMVLVTPNLYKAQKLFDSLSSLLPDEQISFFPQDEFITTEMLAMSTEFKLERINTVRKIIEIDPTIGISSSKKIVGLRNIISHAYDSIEPELIWVTLASKLSIPMTVQPASTAAMANGRPT